MLPFHRAEGVMFKRHGNLMLFLLACGDITVAAASWFAGYGLRMLWGHWGLTRQPMPALSEFQGMMLLSPILAALLLHRLGLYASRRTKSLVREIWDATRAVVFVWGVSYLAFLIVTHRPVSRLMMASVLLSWIVLEALFRISARSFLRAMRRRGRNLRHAAIIGDGRLGQRLFHRLRENPWTGIEVTYFVSDSARHNTIEGIPIFRPISAIFDILLIKPVDIVFVALSADQHDKIAHVLNCLSETSVDVQVVPDLLAFSYLEHDVAQLGDLPIISMTHSPQHGLSSVFKRLFDIAFSLTALIVLSPLLLVIALLVKLTSKGPVFYIQNRMSLASQPFKMLKFRSMRPDAEEKTGAVWTQKNDPRVTRIGAILRKSNLDELPQLINILLGHMSVVGPRPERPELVQRFRRQIPRYMLRDSVKPGLTGWAQVHGWRGQTSLRKRIQYDLHYVTHWSFGMDMRIILMTLWRSFRDPNAY
jgi:putative colanic acid biosynthesis UDP-glucose lipid carrier transferase